MLYVMWIGGGLNPFLVVSGKLVHAAPKPVGKNYKGRIGHGTFLGLRVSPGLRMRPMRPQ